jgi:hypothetical protein
MLMNWVGPEPRKSFGRQLIGFADSSETPYSCSPFQSSCSRTDQISRDVRR